MRLRVESLSYLTDSIPFSAWRQTMKLIKPRIHCNWASSWFSLYALTSLVLACESASGDDKTATPSQATRESKRDEGREGEAELIAQGKPLGEWIKILKDKDREKRNEAADAIATLGPRAKAAVPALRQALVIKGEGDWIPVPRALWIVDRATFITIVRGKGRTENDVMERAAALSGLVAIGAEAKELLPLVIDKAKRQSHPIILLIQNLKEPGINHEVGSEMERWAALLALESMGADPAQAVPVFVEGLNERTTLQGRATGIPAICAMMLANMGPPARQALPDLQDALKDLEADVRVSAAAAIWHISKDRTTVLPVLDDALTILKSDRTAGGDGAATTAISIVTDMGPAARTLYPKVLKYWKEETRGRVRESLASALKAMDPGAAAEAGVK